MMKYSDLMADWLASLGYTHCFFVAGGNIMHLLESCSNRMTCIPVVHEVAAGAQRNTSTRCNSALNRTARHSLSSPQDRG
jgi:hypothetical protein